MLIEVKNLTKKYSNIVALNNVNLSIESGKIIGLLGPNGSGKTTLIKIMVGLLKKYTGDLEICGSKIGVYTKSRVAYLPDHDYLSKRFSVMQAVEYYDTFFDDFDKSKCLTLLKQFQINTNMKVTHLSKGNKEKVQLILTLSRDAEVYIFDEPIAGVDPASRDVIFDLIVNNYKQGSTVIISTHLIYDIQDILDEVIFLKQGKILTHQSKKALEEKHEKSIDQLFREVFRC